MLVLQYTRCSPTRPTRRRWFEVAFFDEAGNFVVVGAMGALAVLIFGIARWRDWI